MSSGVPNTLIWGQTDDGALVRVTLPANSVTDNPTSDPSQAPWWPPTGLRALSEAPENCTEPALSLTVDPADPNSWDRLESDLGLFTAEHLTGLVAVHAAVLVRDSTMVLVPGESMVGKTTLCAAALDAHIEVWSDEYALVDPDTGLVRGWPRRLRVRTPDGGANRVPIGNSGDGANPLLPALVATVRFDPSAASQNALDVTASQEGDIVFDLLANTVCAQSNPTLAFRAALAIASRCAGVRGTRGDAAAALHALFDLAR